MRCLKTGRILFFLLLSMLPVSIFAADKEKKEDAVGKPNPITGPWMGAIIMDGEKLMLRTGKKNSNTKLYRLMPGEGPPLKLKMPFPKIIRRCSKVDGK